MPKEETTTEYINTTKAVDCWLDQTTDYDKGPVPVCVKPGKTVFLTAKDFKRNKKQSSAIFTQGLIRPATATKNQLISVDVKDAMSEPEMIAFVKNAEDIKLFGLKLRKLMSINTLDNILEITKQSNKTYNFIETVERRIAKVNKEADEEE